MIQLKKNNEWGDLALSYSILSDICKAKAAILLEDEDNIDLDAVNEWKLKAEKYSRLEKDVLMNLDTEDLERGVRSDEESLFDEHEESGGMRRKKKIEDIFTDPGFLEF